MEGAAAEPQNSVLTLLSSIGSVSTAPSSALVRLGKTSLVCGITLEIAPPELARPNEGFIGAFRSIFLKGRNRN